MKKVLTIILSLTLVGGILFFVLLRPEGLSEESLRQSYRTHEEAYRAVASYLVSKKIETRIGGLLTPDCDFGIKGEQTAAYSAFVNGIEEFMAEDSYLIISDGKTVEFVPPSTGGILTRRRGEVIYNGKDKVDGKETVRLTNDGWHVYLGKE